MPAGRAEKGRVIHTMGFPLTHDTFGGGFIYGMNDTHWSVGFVTGLDARDARNDPHGNLQRFKTHPLVGALLAGGKAVAYGAKAIPEGGYWSMPRLWADGVLLAGDTGGFLNGARLKGIHLAIKSGLCAAEALADAGLFRLALPRSLGGAELDLPTYIQVIEELGKADASTGWIVNQGAIFATYAARMPHHVARAMWVDTPRAVVARRSTTCCSTVLPGSARPRWPMSSATRWGCRCAPRLAP